MSVIKVSPKYGMGSGSADSDRKNAFTVELLVWVSDVNDGPAIVLESSLVPKVGDQYATGNDYDPGSFCQSVEPERDETVEKLFHVTCQYDNRKPEKSESNPLLRPAILRWSSRREEFYFPKDTRGNWYRTPAGVPLENPPATPLWLLILTIKKNVATYNPIAMNDYQDAVNTTPFLGFGVGRAKVEQIEPSDVQYEGSYQFFEMVTSIAFRRIPWHPHYEVAKGRQYKNDDGDLVPTDASGVMTDHEVYMDEAGKKIDPATDPPYLMELYPFAELNFYGLAQFTGLTGSWE